jgi:CBS domain-containing protein
MQVRQVMTPRVEVARPESTLQEVAQKMKSLDVGPIPICNGEKLVGMLTDRDITVRAVAEGRDPANTRAQDVMTEEVLYCFEDDDVQQATEIMRRAQIRRLPVVTRDKRLVGIVSLGDLALERGSQDEAADALEEISEPATPAR